MDIGTAAGGARVEAQRGAPTRTLESPGLALEECRRESGGLDPDCLASRLNSIPAEELGRWLCATDWPTEDCARGLAEVLAGLGSDQVVAYIDDLQSTCSKFTETALLTVTVAIIEQLNPNALPRMESALTPEAIFSGRSEAAVQITEAFISRGNQYLLELLRAGACGYLGGSPAQGHRAALVVGVALPGGEEYLQFLEAVLNSPQTTSEGGMGCFLVHFALQTKANLDGTLTRSMNLLQGTLQDPRFMNDAANQLLRNHASEPAPPGVDESAWLALMDRARAILPGSH